MAVPKKKVSKARRDKRRSSTWKLDTPALARCPKCGAFNKPHRICKKCGYYKGETVIDMTKPEKKSEEEA